MSQKNRRVGTAALALVVTVIITLLATRQTAAQSGVAVCTHFTPATNQNVAAWMNAQQASGRLKFISHQDVLCAW